MTYIHEEEREQEQESLKDFIYEGESANRSQMDIKLKPCYIRT
jgi:hypothetical protein